MSDKADQRISDKTLTAMVDAYAVAKERPDATPEKVVEEIVAPLVAEHAEKVEALAAEFDRLAAVADELAERPDDPDQSAIATWNKGRAEGRREAAVLVRGSLTEERS